MLIIKKPVAMFTVALLMAISSQVMAACELDKGYNLPKGVSFYQTGITIYNKGKCDFSEGLARATQGKLKIVFSNAFYDGKIGFVNKQGRVVIPFHYDEAKNFSEGLAAVKKDDKYGFIDKQGKVVIPFEYDMSSSFSEGTALVIKNDRFIFINKLGKEVLNLDYDEVGIFSEGLVAVKKNNKIGFINNSGKIIIPIEYDEVGVFSQGIVEVKKNGKWGLIDKENKQVIAMKYDNVQPFFGMVAAVKKDDKWGLINKADEVIVPFKYDYISYMHDDNLIRLINNFKEYNGQLKNKYGLANKQGKILLPAEYTDIHEFSEGMAKVSKIDKVNVSLSISKPSFKKKYNYKYGFIDKQGEIVIPVEYDSASDFSEGVARVEKDGESFSINKQGQRVD
ncbi:WG repeat-containing protein [Psychrobacter sp. I-STPA10]|uniref:WG repeat-containing protein n=1 Tax=Psychrobacter sp. I-STPA10 TaxID=2585769 RepID=UPI001E54B7C4|nr:WG repeat-containing protein [Psychrobacter sp. I-STPA10]